MTAHVLVVTSARALLDRLGPFGPSVEGHELILNADPPAELVPLVQALHTGVRAALTGRPWWGLGAGRGPRSYKLHTAAPLPPDVELLCVEGDDRWDRLLPDARLDVPFVFEPVAAGPSARAPVPARTESG